MTDNAVHVSPTAAANAPVATAKAPTAAQLSPKEASFGMRHRRGFIIAIVIGAIMAVLAPLRTDLIPFWPRLAYWQILMVSGATIGLGVTEMVERWGRLRRWPWIEVPAIGILIALPLTLLVMGTGGVFFGTGAGGGVFRFGFNFGVTALISISITALNFIISGRPDFDAAPVKQEDPAPTATPASSAQPAPNRFAERLPLPQRALAVHALEAEDHYLRVHLEGGQSTLILMRLSDAISELPADKGMQTHRSWWVAKNAVRSASKADGRATLTLESGVEAPVSRSYYRAVADGGWLV